MMRSSPSSMTRPGAHRNRPNTNHLLRFHFNVTRVDPFKSLSLLYEFAMSRPRTVDRAHITVRLIQQCLPAADQAQMTFVHKTFARVQGPPSTARRVQTAIWWRLYSCVLLCYWVNTTFLSQMLNKAKDHHTMFFNSFFQAPFDLL